MTFFRTHWALLATEPSPPAEVPPAPPADTAPVEAEEPPAAA